ncbi:MAG: hypothetical protein JNJ61_19710 [Anaerolineae bacterium]|nr:hypothetical protein [Anaerolineae bacterium]
MSSETFDPQSLPDDATVSSRARAAAPWLVQVGYRDRARLSTELLVRYPTPPLLTVFRTYELDDHSGRRSALLMSADGVASLRVEVEAATRLLEFAFTHGPMLTLRFTLEGLSPIDRAKWLERMRQDDDDVTYLWGQSRWEHDYLICLVRRQASSTFANLYAFSRHNFESAVRLTPDARDELLDWLEGCWQESS